MSACTAHCIRTHETLSQELPLEGGWAVRGSEVKQRETWVLVSLLNFKLFLKDQKTLSGPFSRLQCLSRVKCY